MSLSRLLIATHNQGKLEEFRALLKELPLELCDLNSFPAILPVAETGSTFTENASLKATAYAVQAGEITLADDSGLEVHALGGAPGVLSARYAGAGASDFERTEKLLREVLETADAERAARFVSVIAIADASGAILNVSTGVCNGTISRTPRGKNGFGYDPIFIPDGFKETFGELSNQIKQEISHRARASKKIIEYLRGFIAG